MGFHKFHYNDRNGLSYKIKYNVNYKKLTKKTKSQTHKRLKINILE